MLNDLATQDVIEVLERGAGEVGEKKCLVVVTSIDDVVHVPRG